MTVDRVVLGERRLLADQMEQKRARQARIRLETEVRSAALKREADRTEWVRWWRKLHTQVLLRLAHRESC